MMFLLVDLPSRFFWFCRRWIPTIKWHAAAQTTLLLFAFFSCLGMGYYQGKWITITAGACLLVAHKLQERFGLAVAAFFFYLSCNSIWIIIATNRYSNINPYDLMGIEYFSAISAWKMSVFALVLLCLPTTQRYLNAIRGWGQLAASVFFIGNLIMVLWETAFNPTHCQEVNACGGALLNPSLSASMMAICLPFLPFSPLAIAAVALVSILGKTAIGVGMAALYCGLKIFSTRYVRTAFVGVPALIALGWATHGDKPFFNSSGRVEMWSFFLKLWAVNWKNMPFGTGFGTFGIFSINLQKAFGVHSNSWWIWLHNDWLQMLFEAGAVGLLLMVALYMAVGVGLWRRGLRAELDSWVLFAAGMGSNYFLHIGPCCAYAAWILVLALMKVDTLAPTPDNEQIKGDTAL